MKLTIKCYPKFNPHVIYEEFVGKTWIKFQDLLMYLGHHLHDYMKNYINTHTHRDGSTGNLARSIGFYPMTGAGETGWGIGLISALPCYWHVLAYGKKISGETFTPGMGKLVGGLFGTIGYPLSELKGKGQESFTATSKGGYVIKPGVVRPIPYIDETKIKMYQSINTLLARLRKTG